MTQFDRVRQHTAPYINDRIDVLTHVQVEKVANQGHDAMIRRLAELDQEWDIDRALMLNFFIVGGATFAAGVSGKKGLLYLFTAQMCFLGLHALRGWCPPVVVLRRMDFRTRSEIDAEKYALIRLLEENSFARAGAPGAPSFQEAGKVRQASS